MLLRAVPSHIYVLCKVSPLFSVVTHHKRCWWALRNANSFPPLKAPVCVQFVSLVVFIMALMISDESTNWIIWLALFTKFTTPCDVEHNVLLWHVTFVGHAHYVQGAESWLQASYLAATCSFPSHCVWNLWWTRRHWGRSCASTCYFFCHNIQSLLHTFLLSTTDVADCVFNPLTPN